MTEILKYASSNMDVNVIDENKDSNEGIEDLTSKVFRMVVESGKDGVLQSELWKELSLTSRDGSRIAMRLEKRALITRERILENGRWTYKLIAVRLPADTSCIEGVPCLTCTYEHMCSIDGTVSPNTCVLIENWIMSEKSDTVKKNVLIQMIQTPAPAMEGIGISIKRNAPTRS